MSDSGSSDPAPAETIRFAPDTNCIVATLSAQHPEHLKASAEIARRLQAGQHMVVAAHSLAETYSVLTRMPQPNRVAPHDALRQLRHGFIQRAEVVALDPKEYLTTLESAPAQGIAGGRTYDALIAAAAACANVRVFLTFNVRHFRGLLPGKVEIVVPSE